MLNVLDAQDSADIPATRMVQEAERRRIARELHDGVVQSLTALVADLEYFRTRYLSANGENSQNGQQVAEKVDTWQELARDSLTSMRQALGGLRASSELDLGLEHALTGLLRQMEAAGYRVEFECEDWPTILPFEYTSNIYYIVREAVTNICKHAKASTMSICMFSFEGHIYISIADDGRGLTKSASLASRGSGYHQGITVMRERAALLGGRVAFASIPGKGTRVDIDIPLSSGLME
jgi:two-component system, NarL family, sensor histidine kinase DegS